MTEIITWLSGWYNWPFLLPLAVGLIFILLDLVLGGVSDMFGLDADADVDVNTDLDMDAGGPDGVAAHVGAAVMSLTWLGLGKVPLSVLLEMLLISFGITGLLVNALGADIIGSSTLTFPFAVVGGFIVAPPFTKLFGGLFAKAVPADATTSRKPSEFVGEVGTASSKLTHNIGQVRLEATDDHPQTTLTARLHPKVPGDLPRDSEVLLVGHDADKNIYLVTPTNLEL
jgi:hypothetical protein